MKYSDIELITNGHYRVDVSWDYLEKHLERYKRIYKLDLEPDFQRAHVWTEEQKSRYVEYILRDGPSGRELYFNCPGFDKCVTGDMVIVDGKQRLNAVLGFLHNKVTAFGHYFDEYAGYPRMVIASFKFVVNDLSTKQEVLKWYLALNEGGTPHTEEELSKVRRMLNEGTE